MKIKTIAAEEFAGNGEGKTRRSKPNRRFPIRINGRTIYRFVVYFFALIGVLTSVTWTYNRVHGILTATKKVTEPPEMTEELLTVSAYSRPGIALSEVKGIVIHYTANPGTTAEQNRSYFEGLKDTQTTYASCHYIIGLDGEILHIIPDDEVAYASNERNSDTIAIECCHPDESGQFSQATYQSLLHLVAYLMGEYDIGTDNVIRHYDVSGKSCPKYYVEHEDAWETLKEDITAYIDENGVKVRGD